MCGVMQIWFLEHFSMIKQSDPKLRPLFLRLQGNKDIFYTHTTVMNLFKFLKKNKVRLRLNLI